MNIVLHEKTVDAQTTTGESPPRRWMVAFGIITTEVIFTVDSGVVCTALTVAIEGSLGGTKFFPLASHTLTSAELTAKCCMFHIVDKPITLIRSNITTLTSTGVGDVRVAIDLLSYD